MKDLQALPHNNKSNDISSLSFKQSTATLFKIELAKDKIGGCSTKFSSIQKGSSNILN